jgi:4-aminobutyrate aminotransferase
MKDDSTIGKHILDIRGQGLMVGLEFASPAAENDVSMSPTAPKGLSSRVTKRCIEKGMLLLGCSMYEVSDRLPFAYIRILMMLQTVRFIPALNISAQDLKNGTDIFREAVEEVVREG